MPAEMTLADGQRRRCAVLGSPISHSLSPVLHLAAYHELGVDWDYEAVEVSAEELPRFVAQLPPEWRGLSLTMPLKSTVIDLCDRVESRGRLLGSVNTVIFEQDGSLVGHNTDVPGFVRALADAGVRGLDTAIVIGSGATAASALAAAAELGVHRVTVAARSMERAHRLAGLAEPLNLKIRFVGLAELARLSPADLLVSTIPSSGQGAIASRVGTLGGCVFDVSYDPASTPILAAAREAGVSTIPGFDLLLYQAARQVELMVGVAEAPVEAMRLAGLRALASR